MRRLHLFELEDLPWLPAPLRDLITQTVQHGVLHFGYYDVVADLLADAIRQAGASEVVDLCSGAAGPWTRLLPLLETRLGALRVTLTDLYPNRAAMAAATEAHSALSFEEAPVDATAVPEGLRGFRTLFTGFHHLRPEQATAVLRDVARREEGIGIFEFTERRPATVLRALATPLRLGLATAAMRPVDPRRLFWTYAVPFVPLAVGWDGIVSHLRTYDPAELMSMAERAEAHSYGWRSGWLDNPAAGVRVTYLVGWPRRATSATRTQ